MALPMGYRRIALSKEGVFGWRSDFECGVRRGKAGLFFVPTVFMIVRRGKHSPMANGRSNKEIGQVLYISENTVKAHVKSILTKLDAMGRTEAIAIALQRGLIRSR